MNTIELFSGTQSFSKVAKKYGYNTFCIDNNKEFENDWTGDVLLLSRISKKDIVWASPPCTTFSVASISTHWKGGINAYIPKTERSKLGIKLLNHTIKLIAESNPKYWFIENPRGVMRKIIDDLFKRNNIKDYSRVTVWYCQYGDSRAKPTDIWTNLKDWNGKQCKNNNVNCNHERAPRGSKTGTQGLRNAKYRSVIPSQLFEEIFEVISNE